VLGIDGWKLDGAEPYILECGLAAWVRACGWQNIFGAGMLAPWIRLVRGIACARLSRVSEPGCEMRHSVCVITERGAPHLRTASAGRGG
jgi:hypothetical protein